MGFMKAQNTTDALRYASDETIGTARFNALSGAFGALGGDLSAIGINPAGSAVFIGNSATVSLAVLDKKTDASYFDLKTRSIDTDVDLNQAGLVFVFNNSKEESPWKKFTIGLNYNNTHNYDDEYFIQGTGRTSIGDFFLSQANGIPLNLLQLQNGESIADLYTFLGETEGVIAQNAFLGFQSFIIDPLDPSDSESSQYISNIGPGNFNQEYAKITKGYNGKYTINFATQYTNDFYFGLNLNSHIIDYQEYISFYESNNNPGGNVTQVQFDNNLSVLGSGFSAQVGAIAKLTNEFRVGLTYDTPTWYVISEETTQSIETSREENGNNLTEYINPRVLNVYEDYDYKAPGKITASAAYIFGKQALLSFDYSYKDYSAINFDSNSGSSVFSSLNETIENTFKGASTYRLGGEYRIDQVSLRGGLNYQESPYKDEVTVSDRKGFSLGLGYNSGNYNFDVAYSYAQQNRNTQLFSNGLTDQASLDTSYNNIVFTLGFNF